TSRATDTDAPTSPVVPAPSSRPHTPASPKNSDSGSPKTNPAASASPGSRTALLPVPRTTRPETAPTASPANSTTVSPVVRIKTHGYWASDASVLTVTSNCTARLFKLACPTAIASPAPNAASTPGTGSSRGSSSTASRVAISGWCRTTSSVRPTQGRCLQTRPCHVRSSQAGPGWVPPGTGRSLPTSAARSDAGSPQTAARRSAYSSRVRSTDWRVRNTNADIAAIDSVIRAAGPTDSAAHPCWRSVTAKPTTLTTRY